MQQDPEFSAPIPLPESSAERASIVAYLRSEARRFREVSDRHGFEGRQRERVEHKASQIDECATCVERRMDEAPRP